MRSEYIARSQQERCAGERTKGNLVREFHSAGEHVLVRQAPYVLGRFHQIGEILISVNGLRGGSFDTALHQVYPYQINRIGLKLQVISQNFPTL